MTLNFRSQDFLLRHIRHTLSFYDHRAVDPHGGFFQCFNDDGEIFDRKTRTLVGSCRFVFNYAQAYQHFGQPQYLTWTHHGLNFLREKHLQIRTGGYAWKLSGDDIEDSTNHCYGLAFVILAYACAVQIGIEQARDWLEETYALMERRFWLETDKAYASEADENWQLSDYRGQNDNMHVCEALIAAFVATKEARYLERAITLAEQFTHFQLPQARITGTHIWEHYHKDWTPDLDYNKGDTSNHIRPWGVQTGHQTEWAKLLLILDRHAPADWHLPRAQSLFDSAMQYGWDDTHGGLIYGYDLNGQTLFMDKYFWVQAESIAAAALLAGRTGEEKYWQCYDQLWRYAWQFFVDHQYGAWYRILTRENQRYNNKKSYSNKTDYHTMGACYEALRVMTH